MIGKLQLAYNIASYIVWQDVTKAFHTTRLVVSETLDISKECNVACCIVVGLKCNGH